MTNQNGNGNIIKILVQGGLAGALILTLLMFYASNRDYGKIISNHLNHNTEVLIELKTSINQSNEIDKEQIRALGDLRDILLMYGK